MRRRRRAEEEKGGGSIGRGNMKRNDTPTRSLSDSLTLNIQIVRSMIDRFVTSPLAAIIKQAPIGNDLLGCVVANHTNTRTHTNTHTHTHT